MRRFVSLFMALVLVVMIYTPVMAAEGLKIDITRDEMIGNSYSFEVKYTIDSIKEGEKIDISTPFPVNIDGKGIFEVINMGESQYQLIATEDWVNVRGVIGGTKTVERSEDLNPLIINGEAVISSFPPIHNGGHDNPTVAERDRFYKHGLINGDVIDWTVTIGGDEKGVAATKITDEIGNGHEYVDGSLSFEVIAHGDYDSSLVDMVVKEYETSPYELNIEIDTLSPGEILLINYQTKITDRDQQSFANQVIIEGEQKITETVTIEDYSDVGGEKPTEPTEPEDPNTPDEPDKPNKPEPELPQVGESLLKVEYLIATILIGAAFVIYKRK